MSVPPVDALLGQPEPLGKAQALLHDLQALLYEAVDNGNGVGYGYGDGGTSPGAINEGRYLELCRLTRGIHDELETARAVCGHGAKDHGGRRRDDDFDEDALEHGWSVRRVRYVNGRTIVHYEYPQRDGPPSSAYLHPPSGLMSPVA